jgi:hypothetical protein
MQGYLFIGGPDNGLTNPAPDGVEILHWPSGITGRETYVRETLSIGGASLTIFRHEGLTPEHVLELLAEHYKAWCLNRPGGRIR